VRLLGRVIYWGLLLGMNALWWLILVPFYVRWAVQQP